MSTPIAIHRPGGGPPPPPPAGGGGGLGGALKKNKGTLAAGAVGLVVLIAMMGKRTAAAADSATTGTGTGLPGYDSTSNDLYNSIQPEIDALSQQISDLQGKLPTPPSGMVKSGGVLKLPTTLVVPNVAQPPSKSAR